MFLIIFRYLGEAILELEHQYSVDESRHIIATSFPCHFHVSRVNGSTLEAQEWHICNSEWQSGNFVNMSGIVDVTTRIRSPSMLEPQTSSSTFLQTSFSLSKLPWRCPLRFFMFLPHFYLFMHIWQHPLRVLHFEFVFLLGKFALWVL